MGTFRVVDIKELKSLAVKDYLGYLYIIEWGDNIKIGRTANPYSRITNLSRNANKYGSVSIGRIAISEPHTNYIENEKILHKEFSKCRLSNSELFNIDFEEAVNRSSACIVLEDKSKEMEEKSNAELEAMKQAFSKFWGFNYRK